MTFIHLVGEDLIIFLLGLDLDEIVSIRSRDEVGEGLLRGGQLLLLLTFELGCEEVVYLRYLWLCQQHLLLFFWALRLESLISLVDSIVDLVRNVVIARAAEQEVLAAGLQAQNVCPQILGVQGQRMLLG